MYNKRARDDISVVVVFVVVASNLLFFFQLPEYFAIRALFDFRATTDRPIFAV